MGEVSLAYEPVIKYFSKPGPNIYFLYHPNSVAPTEFGPVLIYGAVSTKNIAPGAREI